MRYTASRDLKRKLRAIHRTELDLVPQVNRITTSQRLSFFFHSVFSPFFQNLQNTCLIGLACHSVIPCPGSAEDSSLLKKKKVVGFWERCPSPPNPDKLNCANSQPWYPTNNGGLCASGPMQERKRTLRPHLCSPACLHCAALYLRETLSPAPPYSTDTKQNGSGERVSPLITFWREHIKHWSKNTQSEEKERKYG